MRVAVRFPASTQSSTLKGHFNTIFGNNEETEKTGFSMEVKEGKFRFYMGFGVLQGRVMSPMTHVGRPAGTTHDDAEPAC
jgi:hypothetical protein